jgi:uncharacterized protein YbjT (DUF2867 family)
MPTPSPLLDADREAARARADRLLLESFPPGSTLRSPEFLDGFRSRLYFSFAGDPIVQPHPIGTPEADAFFSGIDYGRLIANMQG